MEETSAPAEVKQVAVETEPQVVLGPLFTDEDLQRIMEEEMAAGKDEKNTDEVKEEKSDGVKPVIEKKQEAKPKTYKELIVGKWQMSQGGGTVTMEFKSDGILSMSMDRNGTAMNIGGTYAWD